MAFDNACYKHEPTLAMQADTLTGQEFCVAQYRASSTVINSKAETQFLTNYLSGLEVKSQIPFF